ncbi:uncharacterized protein LOC133889610 [Phragmites australis]|uniref:uncharacterized protein LOC133889610 n=1 Tax=Phragmites australis TaxID=29695 RepID=UPI002D790227|nr:uncharacterized protein LOC133889610 [Phragmites australis]
MDPCAFVRLTVDQLLLKLPSVPRPSSGAGVHPSTTPCFFMLHLQDHPSSLSRTAPLPLASAAAAHADPVVLSLDAAALQRLSARPAELVVTVHVGQTGSNCGMSAARALGRVRVAVDVARAAAGETVIARDGWVDVGKPASGSSSSGCPRAQIHMVVWAEPDPRYVFQFGGEPECGPVVYQVPRGGAGGGQRQPVFTCRFSTGRRATLSRSLTTQSSMTRSTSRRLRSWLSNTLHGDGRVGEHARREQRKGWTVTIHDLSGSPVAAASMVTPFVPSPGSGRVSRANPGSWLILQATGAGPSSWKPWARLEAWRERGPVDALGYRLELIFDSGSHECAVPIAESSISTKRGGQFVIDPATFPEVANGAAWPFAGGFVMSSTVEGEGRASRPTVQVCVQHVTCMGDVAVFVALSAAVDLCMDACKLFSQRLRKELCQDQDE